MNDRQQKTVAFIREKAQQRFMHSADYEFKRFEIIEHIHGVVAVILEIGRKNDEGTLAQIFARTHCHFFIGPRGGLKAIDNEGRIVKGRRVWAIQE